MTTPAERLDAIERVLAKADPKHRPLSAEGREQLIASVEEAVSREMPISTARVLAAIWL